jgi:hypothetical protein
MSFADTLVARCNATALQRLGTGLVQLDGVDVPGDFAAAQKARQVAGIDLAATDPRCTVATADVPADPVGKTLSPDAGVTTYYVVDLHEDSAGLTVLLLSTEAP